MRQPYRIEWFSGTGGGGQHRNKHANCCRVIHEPTGIRAQATASKSRQTNKRHALAICRARIRDSLRSDTPRYRATSERIRTYHQPDNRVTDHRSGVSASYRRTVDGPDVGPLLEARRRAIAHDEAQR